MTVNPWRKGWQDASAIEIMTIFDVLFMLNNEMIIWVNEEGEFCVDFFSPTPQHQNANNPTRSRGGDDAKGQDDEK